MKTYDRERAYHKAWRRKHPEKCREYTKRWQAKYPEKYALIVKNNNRRKYAENAERNREYARNYRKQRRLNPVLLEASRKWKLAEYHARKGADPNFLLRRRMRTRILMALLRTTTRKPCGTDVLIGCTVDQLKQHIESLWKPGMSWSNYGRYGWHIDHIIPCNKFDLTDPEQQKKCFHFTNVQPLWALDNWIKGDRIAA